ncbi:MAG: hypothetical protein ACLPID_16655 [Beijerinckiaceae bacterium]
MGKIERPASPIARIEVSIVLSSLIKVQDGPNWRLLKIVDAGSRN